MNGNGFKRSTMAILALSVIATIACTSKYNTVQNSASEPRNDSLGAGQPDNEHFKTWDGGKLQLDGAQFIPAEMYDSLAKVDPDFKQYLDSLESRRKYLENHPDNPGNNPLNDSLGVARSASEYFPKVWDGDPAKFYPLGYKVPPELEDSAAKIDPMFKKYLELKNEVRRKHMENEANISDSTTTDTSTTH